MERRKIQLIKKESLCRRKTMEEINQDFDAFYQGEEIIAITNRKTEDHCVIYTNKAAKELMDYFKWNELHPNNLCEQQLALAGYQFITPEGRYVSVVEFVIGVISKNRSEISSDLPVEAVADVTRELEICNRNLKRIPQYGVYTRLGDAIIVGWAHSHPNKLSIRYSYMDHITHKKNNSNGAYCFTQIVNPHRCMSNAYSGEDMEDMKQIWFLTPENYCRLTGNKLQEPSKKKKAYKPTKKKKRKEKRLKRRKRKQAANK